MLRRLKLSVFVLSIGLTISISASTKASPRSKTQLYSPFAPWVQPKVERENAERKVQLLLQMFKDLKAKRKRALRNFRPNAAEIVVLDYKLKAVRKLLADTRKNQGSSANYGILLQDVI
jgi:hypothetical protein